MFFFILFNYTILRDTKDVLVVTAPGSGAEIIPFLKTCACIETPPARRAPPARRRRPPPSFDARRYVNLPGAIAFTALYAKLTNKFSRQQVRRARARCALPRARFAHPRRRLRLLRCSTAWSAPSSSSSRSSPR